MYTIHLSSVITDCCEFLLWVISILSLVYIWPYVVLYFDVNTHNFIFTLLLFILCTRLNLNWQILYVSQPLIYIFLAQVALAYSLAHIFSYRGTLVSQLTALRLYFGHVCTCKLLVRIVDWFCVRCTELSFNFSGILSLGRQSPSPKNGFWRRKNLFLGTVALSS